MPNISGSVLFNVNNGAPTTGTGVANIPVVLQNVDTGVGMVVLTAANGTYTFTNVPAGNYRIVESYSATGGVATPADFTNAAAIPEPTPEDPPVSAIPSPPANTNRVQSLTPNTLLVTVGTANLANQNFVDGPVRDVPLDLSTCLTPIGDNLITAADNGTWGSNPPGTPKDTHPNPEPYPGVVPGFGYQLTGPTDGNYTIVNIRTAAGSGGPAVVWWNTADHTTGDETGRFQMVGGSNPGSIVFTDTVDVKPNTNYLSSTWILNLINRAGLAAPRLGFRILGEGGETIFTQTLDDVPVGNIPTWNEVGTVFNSGDNSNVTIEIFSAGPSANGNDFATDDFSLREVVAEQLVTTTKSVDKNVADVGDVLTYTVDIENTGDCPFTSGIFTDTIPSNTTFVPNSVTVNGSSVAGNPNPPDGIPLPGTNPGDTTTVEFQVTVNTVPDPNVVLNDALVNYVFEAITEGATVPNAAVTNVVETVILENILQTQKSVDKEFASCNDILNYSVTLSNTGTTTQSNIILVDTIPNGTTFVTDSVTIDGVQQVGSNPQTGVNVGTLSPGAVSTVSFQVVVNC